MPKDDNLIEDDADGGAASSAQPPKTATVVKALRKIMFEGDVHGPEKAAKYLIDTYYSGDIEKYREHGKDSPSLKAIADHPDAEWKKGTIHAWLQVHDFRERAGRNWVLGFSHLKEALNLRNLDEQVKLLDIAEKQNWSSRQIREEVKKNRPASNAGRRPDPGYFRALKVITKALAQEDALQGLAAAAANPKLRTQLEQGVAEIEAWLEQVRDALEAPMGDELPLDADD